MTFSFDNIHTDAQHHMLQEIQQEISATARSTGIHALSQRVRQAILLVPRHLFVPLEVEAYAYMNRPLPIGEHQTISQPFIVALMIELLDLHPTDKVLEVGTGSGYQAAILAILAHEVYTIEIIPTLASQAQKRLEILNFKNVYTCASQGKQGWREHAPYDKIIVTAACPEIPQELLEQLNNNGIMVLPLGVHPKTQILTLIHKDATGHIRQRQVLPVVFVPLT